MLSSSVTTSWRQRATHTRTHQSARQKASNPRLHFPGTLGKNRGRLINAHRCKINTLRCSSSVEVSKVLQQGLLFQWLIFDVFGHPIRCLRPIHHTRPTLLGVCVAGAAPTRPGKEKSFTFFGLSNTLYFNTLSSSIHVTFLSIP